MNALVQLRDGQGINVDDFERWELDQDANRYRFFKNGTDEHFLEIPREVVNFVLDKAESANGEPNAQDQINRHATPQSVRQVALEQGKFEAGRFVFRPHEKFIEIIDQKHEVESLRIYNPTDKKMRTIAALCQSAADHEEFEDDSNVVLTMKFRDLEDEPRCTFPQQAFEQMVNKGTIKPVVSPLVEFDGERYRAALNGSQVELWPCGIESSGKIGLKQTALSMPND